MARNDTLPTPSAANKRIAVMINRVRVDASEISTAGRAVAMTIPLEPIVGPRVNDV
jgi:hypothetical protein